MKNILILALLSLSLPTFAFSIGINNSGTRYLQVSIAEDDEKASEVFEIEEAFKYGGNIVMNFQLAVEMADKLNIKHVTGHVRCSDNPEKINCVSTVSYIFNTIGAYGWNYHANTLGRIVFVKPFEND